MSDWNPALHSRLNDARRRPARAQLARVPGMAMRGAVDRGCGLGSSTGLVAQRFSGACATRIDTSTTALASTRQLPRLPALPHLRIGACRPA